MSSSSRSRSPTSRSTTPSPSDGDVIVLDELSLDSLLRYFEKSLNLPGNTNAEILTADAKIDLIVKHLYERERELGGVTDCNNNNNQILPSVLLDYILRYSICPSFTPSFDSSKAPSVASDGALQQLQQFSAASAAAGGDLQLLFEAAASYIPTTTMQLPPLSAASPELQVLFASASSDSNRTPMQPAPPVSAASPEIIEVPDSPRPTSTSPDHVVPLRRPPPTAGYRAKKERYRPPVQANRLALLQHAAAVRKEAFQHRGTYSHRKPQPANEPVLQGTRLPQNHSIQSILKLPPVPQPQEPRLAAPLAQTSHSILKFPQHHQQLHDPRRIPVICLPLQPCSQAYQEAARGRPRVRTTMPQAMPQQVPPPVDRSRKRHAKVSLSDTWNKKVQRTMESCPGSLWQALEMQKR